jgi:hypothetical protein
MSTTFILFGLGFFFGNIVLGCCGWVDLSFFDSDKGCFIQLPKALIRKLDHSKKTFSPIVPGMIMERGHKYVKLFSRL